MFVSQAGDMCHVPSDVNAWFVKELLTEFANKTLKARQIAGRGHPFYSVPKIFLGEFGVFCSILDWTQFKLSSSECFTFYSRKQGSSSQWSFCKKIDWTTKNKSFVASTTSSSIVISHHVPFVHLQWTEKLLPQEGKVIPGFGHAVLRYATEKGVDTDRLESLVLQSGCVTDCEGLIFIYIYIYM